jgi:hypothetical protein
MIGKKKRMEKQDASGSEWTIYEGRSAMKLE